MDNYLAKPVEISNLKRILDESIATHLPSGIPLDSAARAPDNLPIDYAHLNRVIGSDDQQLIHEVLQMFWEGLTQDLTVIEQAIEQQEIKDMRSKVHGVKGAAASSGALILSDLLKQLENMPPNIDEMKTGFARVQQAVQALHDHLISAGVLQNND